MKEQETDVLIVGAGPVGLLTGLLLAQAGIRIQIIDREERVAARSYACALHPASLAILNGLGLAEPLIAKGRRIPALAFYEGTSRCSQVTLADSGEEFPFLLALPQSELESALERKLREQSGVSVRWNHRFDKCEDGEEDVVALVERLGGTGTGYIVPHWETMVMKRLAVRARILIGADGHNSLVRERLGLEYEPLRPRQSFAVVEFTADSEGHDEVRAVLDDETTNVLWPLPQHKFRWTFQLTKTEVPSPFPEKARDPFRFAATEMQEQMRNWLERVIRHRAPWFRSAIKDITWCTQVSFQSALAKSFGRGRCWLAGDAAHQSGPVGVQSMNIGLLEAQALATAVKRVLLDGKPLEQLSEYNQQCRHQWRGLFALDGGLQPGAQATAWARQRADRILPCLPASAETLSRLAAQLGLQLAEKIKALAPAA
ncbi:MAG: hypothetical protein C5B50_03240 [Verrucomicrobia bacterium]|nr:MAG: hypothetical protein C5B50_03240 [Verrucomicrobiota bacterium]